MIRTIAALATTSAAAACLAQVVGPPPVLKFPAIPPSVMQTLAGGGNGDGGPATAASVEPSQQVVGGLSAMAFLPDGTLYFVEPGTARLRSVAPDGIVRTVAIMGPLDWFQDPPTFFGLPRSCPSGLARDGGTLLVADPCAHRLYRVDPSGGVFVVAGTGARVPRGYVSPEDTPVLSANLNQPRHVAVGEGGEIFLLESGNLRIRRIANGVIRTFAGNGNFPTSAQPAEEVLALNAEINPFALASDGAGGVLFTELSRVRQVDAAGVIRTFAGGPSTFFSGDSGPALGAGMSVLGIARDLAGNVYVTGNLRSRRIGPDRVIRTVAGTGVAGTTGDGGPAVQAQLSAPGAITVDFAGRVVVWDDRRLRRIDVDGSFATVAGSLVPFVGDGPDPTLARFERPHAVAVDRQGIAYVADPGAHRVRRILPDGAISTLAGTGIAGFGGDGGPAAGASLSSPGGVAVDADGNVYIADSGNHRIRKVDGAGRITTIAGSGAQGLAGDGGPATLASLDSPGSVAVDDTGRIYIAESRNRRIRYLTPDGTIRSFAKVIPPYLAGNLALDRDGNVIAPTPFFGAFLVLDRTTGVERTPPVLPVRAAQSVAVDGWGRLFVADVLANRISAEERGIVAGSGGDSLLGGYAGDGLLATQAVIDNPSGLAFDPTRGDLVFADEDNRRVRRFNVGEPLPAAFAIGPSLDVPPGAPALSAAILPTGFARPASVAVEGAELSIGCTGIFGAGPVTLQPGQSVCLRAIASATPFAEIRPRLTVGSRTVEWRVRSAAAAGSVAFSSGQLDFGRASVGATKAVAVQVGLMNTGATSATVNGFDVPPNFIVSHDCTVLAVGAACTVNVAFKPMQGGPVLVPLRALTSVGTATVNLAGTAEPSLARHYYASILGREPDAPGQAYWESESARLASSGADVSETWIAMSSAFFASPEYASFQRTDAGLVTDAYRTYLDRQPDPGGLAFWTGQLAQGMPREVLLASFAFSDEFRLQLKSAYGITVATGEVDLVVDLYRGLLGRLPDAAGFAFWTGRFRAARCSVSSSLAIANEAEVLGSLLAQSAEAIARQRTNPQVVGDLYNAYLRRGGDLAGVQYWLQRLQSGESRESVRRAFSASLEFRLRLTQLGDEPC